MTRAATRTAREVVELYNLVVWNQRDLALARELFAATVVRHEVGGAVTQTQDQACQRVEDLCALFDDLHFTLNIVVAGDDGEHVAIVYDSAMRAADTETKIGSIEVFRVVEGRITDVYNCGYQQGAWG